MVSGKLCDESAEAIVSTAASCSASESPVVFAALFITKCQADNHVLIADAGAVSPFVQLLRNRSVGPEIAALLAAALSRLACNGGNSVMIAEAGGVPPLVKLLRGGNADTKLGAAAALWKLAEKNDANRVLIAKAGGVPKLVRLLRDGSAGAKLCSVAVLVLLACNADTGAMIVEAGGIPPLVKLLRDGSAPGFRAAVDAATAAERAARAALAGGDLDAAAAATEALTARVSELKDAARRPAVEAKLGAAAALLKLAENNAANAVAIAEAGGVPPLVQLLRDGSADEKHAAACVLSHLACNADVAVAIALTIGFDAVVELARCGRVYFESELVVHTEMRAAKREAARVLLRECAARDHPRRTVAATAAFLEELTERVRVRAVRV
ncbi:hypothetical protein JL722_7593 [Aureococcus anophagefferens]|nr:hypothetical protein JL722_7593 [Aureococcus anophagefferens]